jgi:hypothetical protein
MPPMRGAASRTPAVVAMTRRKKNKNKTKTNKGAPRYFFVVDTSIVRGAGLDSESSTSRHCRETLAAILHICHEVVMTEALKEEWDRHLSRYASTWLRRMNGQGKVNEVEGVEAQKMRAAIGRLCTERQAEAILKDFHLLEAAWAGHRRILSLDERVRRLLSSLVVRLPRLGEITWVNPERVEEAAIAWLARGAPDEPARCLGAGQEAPQTGKRGSQRRKS